MFNELIFDNCDHYNTVLNITTYCGTDLQIVEDNCSPECIASLFTAAHTCQYLFIRAGLYDNVMSILSSCTKIFSH